MAIQTAHRWITTERVLARMFLILTAILLLATGFSLLTSALWIPVTVGLWLGAAAIVGVAVWGPLPNE